MANSLSTLLDEACARFAGALAIEDVGGTLSYAELAARADDVAEALRREGIAADEPVLVRVSNEGRDLAAFLGVWRAGGVAVPVHRTAPDAVVAGFRDKAGARFAVGDETDRPLRRVGEAPPPHREMLTGAALVVFTSGSTGQPKGVVLGHRALLGKLDAIDGMLRFSKGMRTLLVLQITFSFGIWVSLLTLARGGTLLMHPRFDAAQILAELGDGRATDAAFVPTMLRTFLALPEAARARRPSALGRVLTGGEPLGAALGREARALFAPAALVDIYGLTETATCDFFLMPEEMERFPGTIGRPSPGVEFRIADGSGRELPAGEAGELQIRTRFAMNGYLDEPELTRAAYDDGYFRTGDLARLRPDGIVELVGRAKELVIRGGNKIAPLELDQILAQHPGVAAALTTGVPDPLVGERVHVLIVPRPGKAIEEAELRGWIAERVEKYKRPDAYHFADALPLGRTGKVDRGALRQRLIADTATSPSPEGRGN